ncbi:hypothetical protein [Fulvivirga lutimaris]|uniref:hypothetical protein n=1 Tax=Fulvivirga lutimaris TaxID=1819566 RepID=UPI0012BBF3EB|nr:hypothetical protein [Fulvivirga lutimaris]MTI41996.1 hypothetical protein [Fulvivirga lutimaris]
MAFNGREGKPIPLGIAKKWTKNYRDANPGKTKAIFYGKEKIQALLDEPGAMGIRVYFGQDDDKNPQLVIVSAKEDGSNILPNQEEKDGGGTLLDSGKPCPPDCPPEGDPLS